MAVCRYPCVIYRKKYLSIKSPPEEFPYILSYAAVIAGQLLQAPGAPQRGDCVYNPAKPDVIKLLIKNG